MSKKHLYLWVLYDFSNSFVLMAFLFYFSQWLVIDQGKPVWWYNIALIISSALFIITAPIASKKIDEGKSKIKGLRLWSFFTFIGYLSLSLIVMLTDGYEILATCLYIFSTYAYLVCFLYYTPMLNDVSIESDRSSKSGIGQGANSIGQVAGILVTIPFVNGITLFGDPGRAQTLLPATLIFGILALPMLIWYNEKKKDYQNSIKTKMNFVELFKSVFSYKPLALFLLAYFLFSDVMLTFSNNFPLYLETIHGTSDIMKSILTASILILAGIGSIIFGKIADKKGGLKTLRYILIIWCFIFLAMIVVTDFKVLVPIFLFAGLLFGPIWGISRSLVGELSPPHLLGSSYSYYVVAERFATFVGPAIWSIALIVWGEGVRGYQAGLFFLTILIIVGLFVLQKVDSSRINNYVRV